MTSSTSDRSVALAPRAAKRSRSTKETSIEVDLCLEGTGKIEISTGIGFFDHMIAQLAKHGGWDLSLRCDGDLEIDTHHTIEDVGIALGECLSSALGAKSGVRRFASSSVPLDEALIDVSVDLSGRPFLVYDVDVSGGNGQTFLLGEPGFDPQLAEEFWRALVMASMITLHIRMRSGKNTHHILEASFKAVARALRDAISYERGNGIPSTKGVL